jgi:hypothetical protein
MLAEREAASVAFNSGQGDTTSSTISGAFII